MNNEGKHEKAVTIQEPDDNAIEKVQKDTVMPGEPEPSTGKLCVCAGTVTGQAGDFLQAVYFKNVSGNDATITVEEVLQSPYYATANSSLPYNWAYNAQLPADQGPAGSELWNTFRSVSVIFTAGPMGMEVVLPHQTEIVSYQGLGVDDCVAKVRRPAERILFAPSPTGRDPADRDGDWLLYRNLSVSEFGRGSRLLRSGSPLRGRIVAFAAANVNWRRGQRRITYINRAVGESTVGSGPLVWFPGAPLSSVVVWQVATPQHRSVIASECRDAPEVIHLDGTDDIYVQVNFNFNDFTSRSGGFDLWVKVID